MRLSSFFFAPLLLLVSIGAAAQSTPNPDFYYGSVIESFHKRDPQMVHFSLLYKGHASEDLDVILVRGGRNRDGWPSPKTVAYFEGGDLLGIFLVNRAQPSLAYELTIDDDINDGYEAVVKVERAEPGEVTILGGSASRKYAYSAASKQLLWKRDFASDGLKRLTTKDGSFVIWDTIRRLGRDRREPTVVAVTPSAEGFRPLADTASLPAGPQGGTDRRATRRRLCLLGSNRAGHGQHSGTARSMRRERRATVIPPTPV